MSELSSSPIDLLDLTGRGALVTGAGQVGRAIATTLAAHGAAPIVVVDIASPVGEELAADLQAAELKPCP